MAELRFEKVTKTYDKDIYVIKKMSFTVHDKEFAVLLGPSGCGKTSILRLIAGLEEITEGKIYIDGVCVDNIIPSKRDIAMVFQNYALYPHMSVYDNIAFGLRMRKYPKGEIERYVHEASEILELTELLERKPRQLSGGERQRVALGRAIVRKPKLFLFDEPLSNLDAKLRVQMRAEISRLHKRLSATIIYVTHDQVEAMTLGEKIIVLKDGEVQQIGTAMDIYHHPNNLFVAGFVGAPPMNFINGFVTKEKKEIVFKNNASSLHLGEKYVKLVDKEIIIGIRPTDFSDASRSKIEIMVDVVEPIGNETYVYGKWGETMIQAKAPEGVTPRVADVISLRINPDKIYTFDGKTEKALRE